MRIKTSDEILAQILRFYRSSTDFNGISVTNYKRGDIPLIIELIQTRKVESVRGDFHPNPHIKALSPEPIEDQISKILTHGLEGCLYPSEEYLSSINEAHDEAAPFTRELKRGAAQLEHRSFDLRLLEIFRNDPDFYYKVDDIHGSILRRDRAGASQSVVADHVELLSFGFAYDETLNRSIAIFLRDLHDLPADQQLFIANYLLPPSYKLHPDFFRTQILGDFPEGISIYDAFLFEKRRINAISTLATGLPLFKNDHKHDARPDGWGVMIRPTSKEMGNFAILLDQLFSDDLNLEFFKAEGLKTIQMLTNEDGEKITQSIGTIKLLEKWIYQKFEPAADGQIKNMLTSIRKVRKARSKPAHLADDNKFDGSFLRQQRELMNSAFSAIRLLRFLWESHPVAKRLPIEEWYPSIKIWGF